MWPLQAAIITDAPIQLVASVLGPMIPINDVWVTRDVFTSHEFLLRLLGTVESRVDRMGKKIFKSCPIPAGTKPPDQEGYYKVLKNRLDYGIPETLPVLEMRSPDQKFYAAALEHPDTIIVPPNEWHPQGMTEQEIFNYYEDVSDLIIGQYVQYGLDGMTVIKVDDRTIVKRHANLDVLAMQIGNHTQFDQLNSGRTVEFHFVIAGLITPFIWLDLDPKPEFPWDEVKEVTAELVREMLDEEEIVDATMNFSGKNGFHIYGKLRNPIHPADGMKLAFDIAHRYIEKRNDPRLTTEVTKEPNSMRLDCSTLHTAGGLRMAYSLAYPTGLVCMPVPMDILADFDKNMATPAVVLRTQPMRKKSAAVLEISKDIHDIILLWWREPDQITPFHARKILEFEKQTGGYLQFKNAVETIMNRSLTAEAMTIKYEQIHSLGSVDESLQNSIRTWWNKNEFVPEDYQLAQVILHFVEDEMNPVTIEQILHFAVLKRPLTPEEHRKLSNRLITSEFLVQKHNKQLTTEGSTDETDTIDPYHTEFFLSAVDNMGEGDAFRLAKMFFDLPALVFDTFIDWIEQIKSMPMPERGPLVPVLVTAAAPLQQYQAKRKFDITSEPKGEINPEHGSIFVVQEHKAEQAGLHYDFRLAMHGVLKSWVIPKLPLLQAGKQFRAEAIPVEDHPLEYATFKGDIPSGEYGGGHVDIWDSGTYNITEQRKDVIKFNMDGKKMQGPWTLFLDKKDQKWYLIRGKQEHVDE